MRAQTMQRRATDRVRIALLSDDPGLARACQRTFDADVMGPAMAVADRPEEAELVVLDLEMHDADQRLVELLESGRAVVALASSPRNHGLVAAGVQTVLPRSLPPDAARQMHEAVVRHRTARLLAEGARRHQDLMEHLGWGVLVVDDDDRVVFANPAACGLFDADREDMLGRRFAVPEPNGLGFREAQAPGDRVLEVQPVGTAWRGRPARILCIQDVTHRSAVEGDLSSQVADLDAFAAMAAHDLKGPLRTVAAQLRLLHNARPDVLAHIQETLAHMDGLVGDLLAYARAGHASSSGSCDAAEVAAHTARDVDGVSVTLGPLPRVGLPGPALRHVLLNLLQNARTHAGRDCQVHVHGAVEDDAVRIIVDDDGPGVPTDMRDRAFDAFQARGAGTGLGLAICRRLLSNHGATIGVDDAPEGGARFIITARRA